MKKFEKQESNFVLNSLLLAFLLFGLQNCYDFSLNLKKHIWKYFCEEESIVLPVLLFSFCSATISAANSDYGNSKGQLVLLTLTFISYQVLNTKTMVVWRP